MDPLLQKIQTTLEPESDLLIALVFGSYSRGTARVDSDLDVAVLESNQLSLAKKIYYINLLSEQVDCRIDLVDLYFEEGLLLKEIISTGQVLVNRQPELYLRLVQKMHSFTEDYEPIMVRLLQAKLERCFHAGAN